MDKIDTKPKNRAEQLMFIFKKFLWFIQSIYEGSNRINEQFAQLVELFNDQSKAILVCGLACDIVERYSQQLKQRDITAVFKLITSYSKAASVEGMAQEATWFCDYLESHPGEKDKFFKFTDALELLVSS